MTQDVSDKSSEFVASSEAARSDPQLFSICELGQLMTLSPKDLIAKINLDTGTSQLAAAVAQNHARNDPPLGVPTGSGLASLASFVSTLERNPVAALEPGLATAPQAHRHVRQAPASGEEPEPHQDDGPMPILSTWRQAASKTDERWLRQRIGAAGLIAALVLTVPALFWLGGWYGTPPAPKSESMRVPAAAKPAKPAPVRVIEVPVRPVAKPELATRSDTRTVRPGAAAEAAGKPAYKVAEAGPTGEKAVQEARRRMESGDVTGAREILTVVGSDPHGIIRYALAETYDPNMLAAWGIRSAVADVARAKAFYGEALNLGVASARLRLDALE